MAAMLCCIFGKEHDIFTRKASLKSLLSPVVSERFMQNFYDMFILNFHEFYTIISIMTFL